MSSLEDNGWNKFPEKVPPEGKYLVLLSCGKRQWSAVAPFGRCQVHDVNGFVGHRHYRGCWMLCCEFHDTKILAWRDIK